MIFTKSNLLYIFYIAIGIFVLWVFLFGHTKNDNKSNSDIEIINNMNSPNGQYDYYIKNPKFQFLDREGNIKVVNVLGLYVNIDSPIEITCKVESVDEAPLK